MAFDSDDVITVIPSTDNDTKSPQKAVFGDNRIYCGKLFSGPGARPALGTLLLITVPTIMFHAAESPIVIKRNGGWVLVVLIVALHLFAVAFLFFTTFTDPGILPRRPAIDERRDTPPTYLDVVLQGHHVRIKWCRTCVMYRPPRSTHCSVCDNCVEDFDHHCPWVGNCIGKRNYRSFIIFLTSTTGLTIVVLTLCIFNFAVFAAEDTSTGNLFSSKIVAFIVGLLTFLMVWFVTALGGFHAYLVSTNQTTYEKVKAVSHWTRSPFYRGIRSHARRLASSVRKSFIKLSDRTCINHPSFDPAHANHPSNVFDIKAIPTTPSPASDASHASSIDLISGSMAVSDRSPRIDSPTAMPTSSLSPRAKKRKKKARRVLRSLDRTSSTTSCRHNSPPSGSVRKTKRPHGGRATLSHPVVVAANAALSHGGGYGGNS